MRYLIPPEQREAIKAEHQEDEEWWAFPPEDDVQRWAARLTQDWRKTVASLIKTGTGPDPGKAGTRPRTVR